MEKQSIEKFYSLSVPCKTQFTTNESILEKRDSKLYLNPNMVVRFGPNNTVIVQNFFSAYYIPLEIADIFRHDAIDAKDLDRISFDFLARRRALLEKHSGSPIRKTYEKCVIPYYANFEVTGKCNAACECCYVGDEQSDEPSFKELEKRIDIMDNIGVQYLEIAGKEPLLREDIHDVLHYISSKNIMMCLHYISSKNIMMCLLTNGSTLRAHIDNLKSIPRLEMCISLDGSQETHDYIRRFPGLYDKVISSLEALRDSGLATYLSTTVNSKNIDEIPHVLNVANKYKTNLIVARVVPHEKDFNYDFSKVARFLAQNKDEKIKVFSDALARPKEEVNKPSFFYGCDFGRKFFTVKLNGMLSACVYKRDAEIGKLGEISIEQYNRRIEEMRLERLKHLKPCSECLDEKCGGPCLFSKIYEKWKE